MVPFPFVREAAVYMRICTCIIPSGNTAWSTSETIGIGTIIHAQGSIRSMKLISMITHFVSRSSHDFASLKICLLVRRMAGARSGFLRRTMSAVVLKPGLPLRAYSDDQGAALEVPTTNSRIGLKHSAGRLSRRE
jgi:hypothetical protein